MARKAKQKAKAFEATKSRAFVACHQAEAGHDGHGPVFGHPEQAQRVKACGDRLRGNKSLWSLLKKLPARRATDSELQLAHDESHIKGLAKLADLAAEIRFCGAGEVLKNQLYRLTQA